MQTAAIRKATVDDASEIASVHVRSWQVAYRGHMPDDFLDGLDVEKRANMWRQLTQDPGKIIFIAEDAEGTIVGFSALGPYATQMRIRARLRLAQFTFIQISGKKELVAHSCPRRSAKFESASFINLLCGCWKQTNEHALFTKRSDLSRMVSQRMMIIGKTLSYVRFVIALICEGRNKRLETDLRTRSLYSLALSAQP